MGHLSLLLSTLLVVGTAVHGSRTVRPRNFGEGSTSAKAIFFQTNHAPNSIVAVPVDREGHLGQATFHLTGADGEAEVGADGPNPHDSLGTESSVVVVDNYLFNVNSGSDSVSLFYIPPEDPTSPRLVGSYPTNGGFPNSLTVYNDLVCVGHGGNPAGVSCASWSPRGISKFDDLRSLVLNQSDPPNTSLNLMSQVYFTGDGSWLVVNIRGGTDTPSFIVKYEVERGGVSDRGDVFLPVGSIAPFGTGVVSGSSLAFISDPNFGGMTIDLNNPDHPVSKSVVPGQKASCWAKVKPGTASGILPDAALDRIVEIDLFSGEITQEFNSTFGLIGNFDFAIDNSYKVFTMAFSNTDTMTHVSVFDASGKITGVDSSAIEGTDVFSHGMAVYNA